MSINGPSGRGEESGSQAPQSTAARRETTIAERPDQHRLAGAGLALQQDQPARTGGDVVQQRRQGGEQGLALQQLHAAMVGRAHRYRHR